ncbi:hypothetical protein ACFLV3_00695 [Chloroflexota bacterium]
MRKGQVGQALILVLILLAVGSLLIIPNLLLSSNAVKNSRIVTREVKALYAADGAQEWMLWQLTYGDLAAQFVEDGDEAHLECDVCGFPVGVTIIMRALEGGGGINLATDDVIRPMKSVIPNAHEHGLQTYTYTIRMEQLSNDNSEGLDAVYDILPVDFDDFDYIAGSSELSVDGGPWQSIADPSIAYLGYGGRVRLQWPATYDYATGTGGFDSPIRDFAVRQVKELRFQMQGTLSNNEVHCNWAVLKPWDTVSGPQAPISVGSPAIPGVCDAGGLLAVSKTCDPELIQPGVETDITYTISITNQDGFTHQIQEITDYLPGGFTYIGPTTGDITTLEPQLDLQNINGVDRWVLLWIDDGIQNKSIGQGETKTLTFMARTTKDVSGSYYNELVVIPDVPVPKIFTDIGVTDEEYYACYSWNTGTALVPFYDGRTDANQVVIDSNIALILGGVAVNSWQVY